MLAQGEGKTDKAHGVTGVFNSSEYLDQLNFEPVSRVRGANLEHGPEMSGWVGVVR